MAKIKSILNVYKPFSKRNIIALFAALGLLTLFNNFVALHNEQKIRQTVLDAIDLPNDINLIKNRDEILNDYKNKVSSDFKIPSALKDRVAFWFDVYSKYDSNHRIIHDSTYPWVIYKIVDVAPIINAEFPKHRWMRNQKADNLVKKETAKIRAAMISLSKKSSKEITEKLNEYELAVKNSLLTLPGKFSVKITEALENLRVQTGQKNFIQQGLIVSPLYLPAMEESFRKLKVPLELTRIPFVETSFNQKAVSKVGASGLWQFMDYTGRKLLRVDSQIDERNSPFKSAEAAAKLLKENHTILYKSWPLAVTAWNHGPTGLRKAIKEVKSKDLSQIIDNYSSKSFDFASANFYSEFLAALYTERYQDEIFNGLNHEKALDIYQVKLTKSMTAKNLLHATGLSKDQFVLFNPDLIKAIEHNTSVPKGFKLMLNEPAKNLMKNLLASSNNSDKRKLNRGKVSANISPMATN